MPYIVGKSQINFERALCCTTSHQHILEVLMIDFNIELKNKVVNSAVKAELATIDEANVAIQSLTKLGSNMPATSALVASHRRSIEQAYGRLLGMLKADNDTRPISARAVVDGIPVDNLIKIMVDEHVRLKRPSIVNGYNEEVFNVKPNEESVTMYFGITKDFVMGFATSYSWTISEIAKKKHKKFTPTDVYESICSNKNYFFFSDFSEYRIDGKYEIRRNRLYFGRYFGYGIPRFYLRKKIKVKEKNKGLYEKLQKAY